MTATNRKLYVNSTIHFLEFPDIPKKQLEARSLGQVEHATEFTHVNCNLKSRKALSNLQHHFKCKTSLPFTFKTVHNNVLFSQNETKVFELVNKIMNFFSNDS